MFLFPHIFQFGNGDLRCFPPPPHMQLKGAIVTPSTKLSYIPLPLACVRADNIF